MRRKNNYINERKSASVLNKKPRPKYYQEINVSPSLREELQRELHDKTKFTNHLRRRLIDLQNQNDTLVRQNNMYFKLFMDSQKKANSNLNFDYESPFSTNYHYSSYSNHQQLPFDYIRQQNQPLTKSVTLPYLFYSPQAPDIPLVHCKPSEKENPIDLREFKKDLDEIKAFSSRLNELENIQQIQLNGMNYLLNKKVAETDSPNYNNNRYAFNPPVLHRNYNNYYLNKEMNDYVLNRKTSHSNKHSWNTREHLDRDMKYSDGKYYYNEGNYYREYNNKKQQPIYYNFLRNNSDLMLRKNRYDEEDKIFNSIQKYQQKQLLDEDKEKSTVKSSKFARYNRNDYPYAIKSGTHKDEEHNELYY